MDDQVREILERLKGELTDLGLPPGEVQQNLEGTCVDAVRAVLGLQPGEAFPEGNIYGAIHQGVRGIMDNEL